MISVIKTRLAEIARTVAGVKRAYAEAPQSLPASDLPIFVSFAGPVTAFSNLGEQLGEETRTYLLRLYVKPIQQGYDGEAEKAAEPFLDSVRDKFLSHPALGLGTEAAQIAFVEKMTWQGDGGLAVLPFAGENYLGAEFRISVQTLVPIAITAYE
jgi:hypothetical protein